MSKFSKEETNEFFIEFNKRKNTTYQAYEYIQRTADCALSQQDYNLLLSLIPYMESGEGYYAFRYIGEVRRIYRILSIISMEKKFQKELFCYDCSSLHNLMDKYVMVLFALRRLTFNLSDESVDEALFFLQSKKLSPFVIYILTKDELIIPNKDLYETILYLYDGIWSEGDKQQFLALTTSPITK